MDKLSRSDVIRKCIVMFEALKRLTGKGNAGLEPANGAEESYDMNCQVLDELREMLREMEAGEQDAEIVRAVKLLEDERKKTIEMIRAEHTEEARETMTELRKALNLEPKDWQNEIMEAGRPPERLDLK